MICPTNKNEDAGILLDYCAQTLSPVQTAELEAHLKECSNCLKVVEAQKAVWGALDQWTPMPVSADFDARLYARIAREQEAPGWQSWLRRIFQPAVPYTMWKAAVPVAACAVLALGLFIRVPDFGNTTPQLHADKVDIEQVEQTLEELDILTPVAQAPAGSM